MIARLKKLLGIETVDFVQLMQEGAIILDVRTSGEFSTGHIRGALNISINQLDKNLHKLKDKHRPIITCCASGMRSAAARTLLQSNGFSRVHNGGSWMSLRNKILK